MYGEPMQQDTTEWIASLWEYVDEIEEAYAGELPEAIEVAGKCHDCGCDVSIWLDRSGKVVRGAGGLWHFEDIPQGFVKCGECLEVDQVLRNFRPIEVWSRVVGYLRPVKQWNKGKQAEFRERVNYDMDKSMEGRIDAAG